MKSIDRAIGIALLSLCAAVGCDGVTRLSRIVQNDAGDAVRGATVILSVVDRSGGVMRADTAVTQSNGYFDLWLTHAPYSQRLLLRVESPGYRPFEQRWASSDTNAVPRRIVLQTAR